MTLNPALDYIMNTDGLRFDDINRSCGETLRLGGKGINVSVILKCLGVQSRALGFAAGFTGRELLKLLREEGIDCDFVTLENGNTRINVKIRGSTPLEINARGPAVEESDIRALEEKLDGCEAGDFLVLAGAVPESLPADCFERMIARCGKGIQLAVDTSGELLLSMLKHRPFLIKPNHHELGDCFNVKADTDEAVVYYAKQLQKLGARNVLVSRAEKGAILLIENGEDLKTGNAKGKAINRVGCGDSMLAGFLAGYLQRGSYKDALILGTACGNATAYADGLARREEIDRLTKEVSALLEIREL